MTYTNQCRLIARSAVCYVEASFWLLCCSAWLRWCGFLFDRRASLGLPPGFFGLRCDIEWHARVLRTCRARWWAILTNTRWFLS